MPDRSLTTNEWETPQAVGHGGRTYGPQRMGHPRYGEGQKSIGSVGHPGRYTSMVNLPIRGCTRVAIWAQACGPHHSKKLRRRFFRVSLGESFGGCLQVELLRSSGAKSGLLHLLTRSVCC